MIASHFDLFKPVLVNSVSDILGLDDQTLLDELDDDALLFDDYDEYEDDYEEYKLF